MGHDAADVVPHHHQRLEVQDPKKARHPVRLAFQGEIGFFRARRVSHAQEVRGEAPPFRGEWRENLSPEVARCGDAVKKEEPWGVSRTFIKVGEPIFTDPSVFLLKGWGIHGIFVPLRGVSKFESVWIFYDPGRKRNGKVGRVETKADARVSSNTHLETLMSREQKTKEKSKAPAEKETAMEDVKENDEKAAKPIENQSGEAGPDSDRGEGKEDDEGGEEDKESEEKRDEAEGDEAEDHKRPHPGGVGTPSEALTSSREALDRGDHAKAREIFAELGGREDLTQENREQLESLSQATSPDPVAVWIGIGCLVVIAFLAFTTLGH